MKIAVDIIVIKSSIASLQRLTRTCEQRARDIRSAQGRIRSALGTNSGQRLAGRVSQLSAETEHQGQRLHAHVEFLTMAATRYEAAESTLTRATSAELGGADAATISDRENAPTPAERHLIARELVGAVAIPAQIAGEIDSAARYPASHTFTFTTDLLKEMKHAPIFGVPGRVMTVSSIANELDQGDYAGAVWEAVGLTPIVGDLIGAAELGYDIGIYISEELGVADWVAEQATNGEMPQWLPYFEPLDMSDELTWVVEKLPVAAETVAEIKEDFNHGVESFSFADGVGAIKEGFVTGARSLWRSTRG